MYLRFCLLCSTNILLNVRMYILKTGFSVSYWEATKTNKSWNSHHTVTESPLCVKPVTLLLNGIPTLKPRKHVHRNSFFDGSKPSQWEPGLVKNKCVACSTLAPQKNKNKHIKFNKNTKNPTQNIPKSEPPLLGREFDNTRPALQPPKLQNDAAECPRKPSVEVSNASVFVSEPFRLTKYSSGTAGTETWSKKMSETRCMAWQKCVFRKGHPPKTIGPCEGRVAAPQTRLNHHSYRLTMPQEDAQNNINARDKAFLQRKVAGIWKKRSWHTGYKKQASKVIPKEAQQQKSKHFVNDILKKRLNSKEHARDPPWSARNPKKLQPKGAQSPDKLPQIGPRGATRSFTEPINYKAACERHQEQQIDLMCTFLARSWKPKVSIPLHTSSKNWKPWHDAHGAATTKNGARKLPRSHQDTLLGFRNLQKSIRNSVSRK